jgi:hypothetical protein
MHSSHWILFFSSLLVGGSWHKRLMCGLPDVLLADSIIGLLGPARLTPLPVSELWYAKKLWYMYDNNLGYA